MTILVLGCIVFLIGLGLMRNEKMNFLLKSRDHETWNTVMQPQPSGYVDSFGTIQLFTWILSHGYEKSSSEEVRALGHKALRRAKLSKYFMLTGIVFMVVGFFVALMYSG